MTTLRFLFRVDASADVGTGHVTRCVTLAKKIRTYGHTCELACRIHVGNLVEHIESQGVYVLRLFKPPGDVITEGDVRSIRPGYGLAPKHKDGLICKTLKSSVVFGQPVAVSVL